MNTVETNMADAIAKDKSKAILVKASAGTGKTYCLVERIKALVDMGVDPKLILAFSFTVDAAQNIRQRVTDGDLMTIGTIHSVSYRIIREYGEKSYYVLDSFALSSFVFDIFKKSKIEYSKYNQYMARIDLAKNIYVNYYSLVKNNGIELRKFFGNDLKLMSFAKEFESRKESQHKITFSDMQLKAYCLLTEKPNILSLVHERWKYIFLDEAQDASNVDIALVNILANKYKQLFVVGDIKQKIFSWRTG